jgi:hypothetical protein
VTNPPMKEKPASPPRCWIARDHFDLNGKPYQERIRVYAENPSMPGIPCFLSETEHEHLIEEAKRQARAEAFAAAECILMHHVDIASDTYEGLLCAFKLAAFKMIDMEEQAREGKA